ncbi:serine-rich adhesin for platelets [Culicoides brevitarsis]|uniref:serine-rich adhesin for platelets n=1 Tax=Culicoides brevitarsis TaxID=469753 RepID=UPI00307BA5AC
MQSNEVRIPKNADFDLSPSAPPCQYFKSSFARSLSLTSSGTKSLELDINFGLSPFEMSPIDKDITVIENNNNNKKYKLNESPRSLSGGSMGAIKAARSLLFSGEPDKNSNVGDQLNQSADPQKPDWNENEKKKEKTAEESQMTPPTPIQPTQQDLFYLQNSPTNNSDMEILRLRKECQSLIEENRRLIGLASNSSATSSEADNRHVVLNGNGMTITSTSNGKNPAGVVEAVFLQTQIDTLNWQLKQVESSRQMYRAVTKEVAHFLDKCYRSLEAIQTQQKQCQSGTTIGRSKSVVQVSKHHDSDSSCSSMMTKTAKSASRARSSTNLIDAFCGNKSTDGTVESYEQFRDFTWRRQPKAKQQQNVETNPEKLSNEAYRLLRTLQNLMNTQEPLLLNPNTANAMSLEPPQLLKATHDEPFSRKSQSRESRLSLRSSTDDSVHSNATTTTTNSSSSLKTETDEEATPCMNIPQHPPTSQTHLDRIKDGILSSIDDESGFSSMNSFQEIGLPLVNSTMRSIAGSSSMSSNSSTSSTNETEMENTAIENNLRNSTLIAVNNQEKLGLPKVNHRRWDSAPVANNRLQIANPEDSLRVLWV